MKNDWLWNRRQQTKIIEAKKYGQQIFKNKKEIIELYNLFDEKYIKYLSYYESINEFAKSNDYSNQKDFEIKKEINEKI